MPDRSRPVAPCRGERTAKYNQLLRIEEELKRICKIWESRDNPKEIGA
ncbi:MAG: hypothetical protein ACLR78_00195 [Roseburia sp.]